MTDAELYALITEQRDRVPMTTSIHAVVRRGQRLRFRRRAAWATGTATVAGAAAVVVAVPQPGQPAPGPVTSSTPPSRLAAWTVDELPSGEIDVTINQLKDPAGLEQTLRNDGLPANVSTSPAQQATSCQPYATDLATLRAVVHIEDSGKATHLVIDPSSLPSGAGVAMYDDPGSGPNLPSALPSTGPFEAPPLPGTGAAPQNPTAVSRGPALLEALNGPLAIGLVHASPQCTG